MISWWLDPALNDGRAAQAFASLDSTFAVEGEFITKAPLSRVIRVEYEGRRYYVKRYAGNGKNAWRRWFGLRQWLVPPRVKKEWQNLLHFRDWGIPTARLIAYGIERHFGGFRRGALITEEIRDTVDLSRLALQHDPRLKNRHWVAAVSRQIADITRRMHDAGFVHNDLKWRNLLVTQGDPTVYLIDCPNGGFWRGPFLRYRILKDLACLDKVAKYHLSPSQRLRFFLDYTGHQRLNADDKATIRRIVGFFEGRE